MTLRLLMEGSAEQARTTIHAQLVLIYQYTYHASQDLQIFRQDKQEGCTTRLWWCFATIRSLGIGMSKDDQTGAFIQHTALSQIPFKWQSLCRVLLFVVKAAGKTWKHGLMPWRIDQHILPPGVITTLMSTICHPRWEVITFIWSMLALYLFLG